MHARHSILPPKKPNNNNWQLRYDMSRYVDGFECYSYQHRDGFVVMSGLEVMSHAGFYTNEPFYHVSITYFGQRCSNSAAKKMMRDFDMQDAEQDNHFPGKARHFWLPVSDKLKGVPCPCKSNHSQHEGDYSYQPH